MCKKILIGLMLAASCATTVSATNWSDLIGKTLVLYRYGLFQDNWFSRFMATNPAGKEPVEEIVLRDSTHLEWKYSMQGDFARACTINNTILVFKEPLFDNHHLSIVECDGEVLLTQGDDGLTRAFFIQDAQPALSALPVSCNSKKGFCDGKLDDLLPSVTDLTYSSRTPMGRHFLFHRDATSEEKAWLESTKEVFDNADEQAKILDFDIDLFPHDKPVLADVHQKAVDDCNAVSVLADMAFLYPDFIKSIIYKEAADSFRVDMFDPEGRPIVVCVSNRFPVREGGFPVFSVGEGDCYNWISIMEKAAMKWIQVYNHINTISGCNAEMITPMFTGDGRSFCIQPGRLTGKDLARMINTCLEHGMMVNGGFLKSDIPLDGHKTVAKHGHTFLPPQRKGALYAIRNPWGNGADNHIMNVMSDNTVVPPLIDIRVISPGAAAKFFDKNALQGRIRSEGNAKATGLFPSNWRNTKTGDWEIGFYDDFAIYGCQFWNYKQKQQKGDAYSLVLENDGKEIAVNIGKLKKEARTIEIDGKNASYAAITSETLPDYPAKDMRTGFVDNGYRMDTVTIVGWLKDMPEQAWEKSHEVELFYKNCITADRLNAYAKMDSLGRFTLRLPLINSVEVFIDWNRTTVFSFLEPGKTYFLLNDFKTGQKLWMGDDVRVQNELLAYPAPNDFDHINPDEKGKVSAMEFKARTEQTRNRKMQAMEERIAAHPNLSQRFIDYLKGAFRARQGNAMMQARYQFPKWELPQEYLDYLNKEIFRQALKPYSLHCDFVDFQSKYIEQLVRERYAIKTEDGAIKLADEASILRRYRDAGKLSITDEELEAAACYIEIRKQLIAQMRNGEDTQKVASEFSQKECVKQFGTLCEREDVKKIFETERPLMDLYNTLSIMDSLGCDKELRDIAITSELHKKIVHDAQPLPEAVMQYFEENVKMPAAKALLRAEQEKFVALQHKDISGSEYLKSADDVANMSDGEQILRKIIEPYKGKIILVDFWGTWCGPCKAALSHSQEEYEQLKDYDMVFLYLANKSPDEAWKNVIKQYNIMGDNVVHYNLPAAQQKAIENFLNVHAFPTYKLIERNGTILDVNADPRNMEGLIRLLERLE